jgi:transposase-like protein
MRSEDFQKLLAWIAALEPAQLGIVVDAVHLRMLVTSTPIPASQPLPVACAATEPAALPAIAAPEQPDTGQPRAEPPPATTAPVVDPAGLTLAAIDARFAADPACPHCQSQKLGRWGFANGLRRYKCKGSCKATFNALTGTPLAQLHKRELWSAHAQELVDGGPLRGVAMHLEIDLTTAFRWRHRFLAEPKSLKAKQLQGIVEADETYFLESFKGRRKLSRPARSRGGKARSSGLSAEQIPVLIARDRTDATFDEILPNRSAAEIALALDPVVTRDAVLVSDGAKSYRAFAEEAKLAHVELVVSQGERVRGVYHIQNVNAYTSRLKEWMRRFKGVATAYLDTYLGWHRLRDAGGDTFTASGMLSAAQG